jgi:hypothetical protein
MGLQASDSETVSITPSGIHVLFVCVYAREREREREIIVEE